MNLHRLVVVSVGALILIFAAPAISGPAKTIPLYGGTESITIPAGSMLRFKKIDQDSSVYFDGPVEISGTFYYSENHNDDGIDRALYVDPDAATIARLPAYKDHGLADHIYLSNEEAFVKAAISPDKLAALKKDGTHFISGKADVMADQFQAGIECDVPNAQAHFLSLVQPRVMAALKNPAGDEGC
ncbi:MAG TPA: hypothetical protein VHW02_01535 [Rhizomicrobium sp.]|jgi:hypothetical protein|nr:hypothetical protein [Rhizomicrobium sp.]